MSGERKKLFEGDTAHYLPTGHILYAVDNNLCAVPFNPEKLEATGEPIRVVEGVLRAIGAPQYAVSNSGTIVYIPGSATAAAAPQSTLVWVDRNGKVQRFFKWPGVANAGLLVSPLRVPSQAQAAIPEGT